MRILLVKTSSLGDVVHNLPAVSDLRLRFPHAQIDWLVEEGFAAIPALHPAISNIIPCALRRWRKNFWRRQTWREIAALRRRLQSTPYDYVLDTQGLLKSALLCRWAQGVKHGYASDSIREPLAASFYDRQHHISRQLHAVTRNRQLAAAAFGYALPPYLDYGLGGVIAQVKPGTPYVVLLTATSRDDKLWPQSAWVALGRAFAARGLHCILPGGSLHEQARAAAIAEAIGVSHAEPVSLDIPSLAVLLAGAHAVFGVDTGLTHLAAALGRTTVAIFCSTQPGLTGVVAPQPVFNLGRAGRPPDVADVLRHLP